MEVPGYSYERKRINRSEHPGTNGSSRLLVELKEYPWFQWFFIFLSLTAVGLKLTLRVLGVL
ncbi:MAG: hypothetical protein QXF63_05960 [Sulfolobales archaeon]